MFADLELARRLESAEGSAGSAFVRARGGDAVSKRIAGTYVMFDGVESPLTQTFGLGLFEPATGSVMAQIEGFFSERHAATDHEVSPLAGVALLRELTGRGYEPLELSSVLFLDLTERLQAPALNPLLTVRVAKREEQEAYAITGAAGWGATGDMAHVVTDMGRIMFTATGYTGFVVETEGQMIATAGLVNHDRVALLAGASTVLDARGQGAQRAVLAARLTYAAGAGCDLAMMVTEPGGASQRNAERNGFRVAYTRTKWRRNNANL